MRNRNVNLSDFENDLQANLRTDRARKWIFRAFRGKIFKMYLLGTNHGGALWIRSMYQFAQKNSGYVAVVGSTHSEIMLNEEIF